MINSLFAKVSLCILTEYYPAPRSGGAAFLTELTIKHNSYINFFNVLFSFSLYHSLWMIFCFWWKRNLYLNFLCKYIITCIYVIYIFLVKPCRALKNKCFARCLYDYYISYIFVFCFLGETTLELWNCFLPVVSITIIYQIIKCFDFWWKHGCCNFNCVMIK